MPFYRTRTNAELSLVFIQAFSPHCMILSLLLTTDNTTPEPRWWLSSMVADYFLCLVHPPAPSHCDFCWNHVKKAQNNYPKLWPTKLWNYCFCKPWSFRRVCHAAVHEMEFVVQLLSHVQLFATPWTAAYHAPLSSIISEFAQIHVHWVGDAIQPSHPLSSLLPMPSIFPSIGVFFIELDPRISSQSIGASASASVLPVNIQCWFPLGLSGLIFLQLGN